MSFAAVILAGGEGSRLGGVRKAELKLGGVRLLDRLCNRLAAADPLLVSLGQGSTPALQPREAVPVYDRPGGPRGPSAGLLAAADLLSLRAAAPGFLLSVAVDTPFFPASFVDLARGALAGGAAVAVASYAGQPYPTNALWRLAPLSALVSGPARDDDIHSPRRLAARLGMVSLDWPESAEGDPFASVNTLADLLRAERRIRLLRGLQPQP